MTDGLEVRNLSVAYGEKPVLQGISFCVPSGKTLAIIGRSGSGKSTLLRATCALQRPDAGDVFLGEQQIINNGLPLFEEWEIRRNVMMVGQAPSLIPHLTALRNITVALECVRGFSRKDAQDRALKLAEEFRISNVLDSYPEQLSGGELHRVHLARAVVLKPEFLLLDEITSSIDPETTKDVASALYRMRSLESHGEQTCIIVTHHLQFAFDFADEVAFLHDGIIYERGRAAQFLSEAVRPETIRFLDSLKWTNSFSTAGHAE